MSKQTKGAKTAKTAKAPKAKAVKAKAPKAKTVKAPKAKAVKAPKAKAPKAKKMKLIKITPAPNRQILERGDEFQKLRDMGFSQGQVITMFRNAGVEVSNPAYYHALKIHNAPAEVRQAIADGKVVPTLVLPLLKKRFSEKQIVKALNELVAKREQHTKFLQKSGFADGSKLTLKRTVSLIAQKLEKLQKSKSLDAVRGQAALSLTRALKSIHSAEDIETVVASFVKK